MRDEKRKKRRIFVRSPYFCFFLVVHEPFHVYKKQCVDVCVRRNAGAEKKNKLVRAKHGADEYRVLAATPQE